MAEIILAVNSLHEYGIVHRIIKPKNILLDRDGQLRICKVGKFTSSMTTGVHVGLTGIWPQNHHGSFYGSEVDWWAVGCVM